MILWQFFFSEFIDECKFSKEHNLFRVDFCKYINVFTVTFWISLMQPISQQVKLLFMVRSLTDLDLAIVSASMVPGQTGRHRERETGETIRVQRDLLSGCLSVWS